MGEVDLARFRVGWERTAAALAEGRVAEAFAWVPDDFEWRVLSESLPPAAGVLTQPVLHGREEVIEFFEHLHEDWAWRPEPREFQDPGDGTIVVRVVGLMTGRATGLRGEVRFTQTWELGPDGYPVRAREQLEDYRLEGLEL